MLCYAIGGGGTVGGGGGGGVGGLGGVMGQVGRWCGVVRRGAAWLVAQRGDVLVGQVSGVQ